MSLTVKAFLYRRSWKEEPVEIRRFSLDQEVSTNYSYLVQKIAQVFPSVPAEDVVLSWADADGDHITISTDEELLEALDHFDGSIFKIHLRKREKSPPRSFYCQPPVFCVPQCQQPPQEPTAPGKTEGDEEMEEEGEGAGTKTEQPPTSSGAAADSERPRGRPRPHHFGVVCDGCGSGIYGIRFKCLVCPDYDLCSSCEKKGEHVDHNMVTINEPHSYNPWGFPAGPRGHCGGPWRGRGHHCGGRRGRPGGQWAAPPYFLQQLFGGGQWGQGGGGPRGCCGPQQTPQEKPATQRKPDEMETEGTGPQSSEVEREQRQGYLQDIGEAVSTFLKPFGVKVDVGVVGKDQAQQKEEEETEAQPAPQNPSKVPSGYEGSTLYPTLDSAATDSTTTGGAEVDLIQEAVAKLRGMGFDNEGGWLTELVRAKGGDIEKVLDALHPSQSD